MIQADFELSDILIYQEMGAQHTKEREVGRKRFLHREQSPGGKTS